MPTALRTMAKCNVLLHLYGRNRGTGRALPLSSVSRGAGQLTVEKQVSAAGNHRRQEAKTTAVLRPSRFERNHPIKQARPSPRVDRQGAMSITERTLIDNHKRFEA